ncbi:MAG: 50S ribosomal protein L32 [Candidatus Glassbacteria bacterium]
MAVPRRRTSKARKRKRRSHHALGLPSLSKCPQCKQKKEPHRVCPHCGYYGKMKVLEVEEY